MVSLPLDVFRDILVVIPNDGSHRARRSSAVPRAWSAVMSRVLRRRVCALSVVAFSMETTRSLPGSSTRSRAVPSAFAGCRGRTGAPSLRAWRTSSFGQASIRRCPSVSNGARSPRERELPPTCWRDRAVHGEPCRGTRPTGLRRHGRLLPRRKRPLREELDGFVIERVSSTYVLDRRLNVPYPMRSRCGCFRPSAERSPQRMWFTFRTRFTRHRCRRCLSRDAAALQACSRSTSPSSSADTLAGRGREDRARDVRSLCAAREGGCRSQPGRR